MIITKNCFYIIVGFAIVLLQSCGTKKEEPTKPTINYVDVNDVIDHDLLASDTITHSSASFINTITQKEVSTLHQGVGILIDAEFKNNDVGVGVGVGLTTRITKDGGETWLENSFDFLSPFNSVTFSENSIFAVGESEYIFTTPDYGKTWSTFNTKELFENQFKPDYSKIKFITKQIGFISGMGRIGNTVHKEPVIIHNGKWVNKEPKGVGDRSVFGFPVLLKTVDGGKNWTEIVTNGLNENLTGIADFVAFSEKEIIIVTYYGKCYKSIDGGVNWKELYDNLGEEYVGLGAIAFFDNKIGLMTGIGGDLYYTKTGGDNWNKIERPTNSKDEKIEFSGIVFLKNSALITTKVYSERNTRETLVYQIDKEGTNLRPFLNTNNEKMSFKGSSNSIKVLNNNVYVLDRENLYKTAIE